MTKAEAGSRGGKSTVARHGKSHMAEIGRRGARSFHAKYLLVPVGMADFMIVHRETLIPTGRTIRGLDL